MSASRQAQSSVCVSLSITDVKRAVKTYTLSKRFVNTVVKTSVLNILYHRLPVNDHDFITKNFNKIPFKSFRAKSKNPLIREYHGYMAAFKDALEKNFLREMYVYFIDVTGDIVENYKFAFKYGSDKENVSPQPQTANTLTDTTTEFLRALEDLGTHQKLDESVKVKIEFTYFGDTPADYEPPGFKCIAEADSLAIKLGKKGTSVAMGTLFTGFHMLKCRGRGKVFEISNTPPAASNLESAEYQSENMTNDAEYSIEKYPVDAIVNQRTPIKVTPTHPKSPELNRSNVTSGSLVPPSVYSSELDLETRVDCTCNVSIDLPVDIIQCSICNRNFHAPCQGYLDKTFAGEEFRCFYCEEENENLLSHVGSHAFSSVCKLRILIACFYKYSAIPDCLGPSFDETLETLKASDLLVANGNNEYKIDSNVNLLYVLFKFNHKRLEINNSILV